MVVLAEGEDVDALKAKIVTACQGGKAAFVDFESVGRGLISVLMTPNLPVRFETIERSEEQMREWESVPPAVTDEQNTDVEGYLDGHF